MTNIKKINFNKGFTLIELLVVVAIIGVLATVVLASLGTAKERALKSKLIASVSHLEKAAELAYIDYGAYPGRFDYYPGPPADETSLEDFRTQFDEYFHPDDFLDSIPDDVEAFTFLNQYTTGGDVNSSVVCPDQVQRGVGQTYAIIFTTRDDLPIISSSWHTLTNFGYHFYCVYSK